MRRLCIVVIATGCSFEHGAAVGSQDAAPPDVPVDMMVAPIGWSAPVEIAELNSGMGDDDPSLTNDLLEIYWGSKRTGGFGSEDIWVARRASPSDPWSLPANVTELNSSGTETTMKVTGDGLAMYFTSTRNGNVELFFTSRLSRANPWSTPIQSSLTASNNDYGAFVQSNLRHVIFCSGDTVPSEALYAADRLDITSQWPTPTRVAELDESNVSECDPMEPSARRLYYSSDRGDGTYDIYTAHRSSAADPYGSRTAFDAANVPGVNDRDPWVSQDEKLMVFSSDRTGGVDRLYITTLP